MKVIVTGGDGQLSNHIKHFKKKSINWTFVSSKELDISNSNKVKQFFTENEFDLIVNCAAYTAVDMAEDETKKAFLVNEKGVKNIVKACEEKNAKLIQISTDYVFDGKNSNPYKENDAPNPIGAYGKSKHAGEKAILDSNVKSIIIRTSWLYSLYGKNFLTTMLELSKNKSELNIVNDQYGSPTYAGDLAEVIIKITEYKNYKWKVGDLFHFSNSGKTNWAEFAKEIFSILKCPTLIKEVNSVDFPTKASRPKYSRLDTNKLSESFQITPNHWRESLYRLLSSGINI